MANFQIVFSTYSRFSSICNYNNVVHLVLFYKEYLLYEKDILFANINLRHRKTGQYYMFLFRIESRN